MVEVRRRTRIVLSPDFNEEEIRGSTFITGFKGFGATGYIATKYIVSKLKMKRVGVIITRYLPEFAFRDDHGIAFPFELFYYKEKRILVLVNHDLPDPKDRRFFADEISAWLRDKGIKRAILVGGLDRKLKKGEERMRWLATSAWKDALEEPLMDKWLLIIGPLALMLMSFELLGVPAVVLLPYAEAIRYDPYAAAVAVEKINQLTGLSVDPSELYEEARRFEEELERLAKLEESRREGGERIYM